MTGAVEVGGTRLELSTFGEVSSQMQDGVVRCIGTCFSRFDADLPAAVALRFFDTATRHQEEQQRENRALNVVGGGGDPLPVSHSAWGDAPRITVCAERLEPLPELLRQGMVNVAAAHTVLHGSADYYAFKIPADIVRQGGELGIGATLLQRYLYHVATAVKGAAAVDLLVKSGFVADQVALALHQLQVTSDDLLAWQLAQSDARARALYLLAQLRPLLSTYPLLCHAPTLGQRMAELTDHLPSPQRERLLALSSGLAASLSGETRASIQRAFSRAWDQVVREETMQ